MGTISRWSVKDTGGIDSQGLVPPMFSRRYSQGPLICGLTSKPSSANVFRRVNAEAWVWGARVIKSIESFPHFQIFKQSL